MKRTYLLIPVAASILIVGAIVIALWVIGSASGERSRFSSLEIAPHDTDVFFAINTDPTSSQWLAVNHSLDQINAKNSLRQAIDDALADVNLDWERDILPVAGDEAFLSIPDITNVGEDHGWVGGVLLSDAAHAREAFDKLRTQDDAKPLKEQDYNGVTIFYPEPPAVEPNASGGVSCTIQNGAVTCTGANDSTGDVFTSTSSGAVAFVDNVIALGASPDDAKSVIDVVQGRADSAKNNDRLQEFRKQQKQDFLVWGYADLADVWTQVEDSLPTDTVQGDVDTHKAFETVRSTYDRVGFSLSSHSEGYAFDITVVHSPEFNSDEAFEPSTVYEPKIAEVLSGDTMFYLSAFDLYNQSWLPGKSQLDKQELGDGHNINYYLDQARDKTGIDLEPDFLSLLTGEIAVAGNISNFEKDTPDFSVFAIADVNDEQKARSTLDKLETYLLHEARIATAVIGDLHEWRLRDGPDQSLGLAVSNQRLIVGYPDSAVKSLISGPPTDSLANSEDWKRTMELLPADKTFVGFLSIERILAEVRKMNDAEQQFADSTDGKISLSDLDAIRSIGMSGTTSDSGFGLHLVLFMKDR